MVLPIMVYCVTDTHASGQGEVSLQPCRKETEARVEKEEEGSCYTGDNA